VVETNLHNGKKNENITDHYSTSGHFTNVGITHCPLVP